MRLNALVAVPWVTQTKADGCAQFVGRQAMHPGQAAKGIDDFEVLAMLALTRS